MIRKVSFALDEPQSAPLKKLAALSEQLVENTTQKVFAAIDERFNALTTKYAAPFSLTFYLGSQANQVNTCFEAYFKAFSDICWKKVQEEDRAKKLEELGLRDKLPDVFNDFLKGVAKNLLIKEYNPLWSRKVSVAIWEVQQTVDDFNWAPPTIRVNALTVHFWMRVEETLPEPGCFKKWCSCFVSEPPPKIEVVEDLGIQIWKNNSDAAFEIFESKDLATRVRVTSDDPRLASEDEFLKS